ncbi:GNAT family N-acetyltransferase [Luteipulveratus sp. YIM 133132]|uniref:GNAT family N-acetyltransferase n=1 Tax=Luteipulveratus flavus TaxID=3031728 RepID=UPI0023B07319|nr:GNAT family N-acetyltransferase [Luteipulveratus sp. YIM 133132]MDE9364434.1 GNAT family N-acetyltransferase [Luteipulveratus sp. YIM 133132]
MSPIRIEQARPDEAIALAALVLRADREDGTEGRAGFLDEYADAWLADRAHRPTWIATRPDGAPVGLVSTVVVRKLPSLRRPTTAWMHISLVYVVPEERGHGLAERMLRQVLEWGSEQGVERVDLGAVPEARTLYERVGFGAPDPRMMELRRPR